MSETAEHTHKYFWSGWFSGQSFATLAGVFVLLSFVDLLATLRMILVTSQVMSSAVREGNLLADTILREHGPPGFIVFKTAMVAVVIGAIWLVNRSNPRLAHAVLWGGNLVMAFVACYHVAIMTGLMSG